MSPRATLALGLTGVACFGPGLPDGARQVTPADRAGKVEAAFVCESPLGFTTEEGGVVEPRATEREHDAVVYNTATGLVLVQRDKATTNRWFSDGRAHFFDWYPDGVGAELIVAEDERSATHLLWAKQPQDASAYVTEHFPDGSTRPTGLPTHVDSCVTRELYDSRLEQGKRPFEIVGATPVSPAALGAKVALRVNLCKRAGPQPERVADANRVPDWAWLPYEVLLPATQNGVAYLSFERLPDGSQPLWRVDVSPEGHFRAELGFVRFIGLVNRRGRKPKAAVMGQIISIRSTELFCAYE